MISNSSPRSEGIATDGAHSSKNGCTQYRGIDLRTGLEIFRENLGNKTVNVGEFLGVVAAIKYILEHDYKPRVIYTDSQTAIAWIKYKKTNSKKRMWIYYVPRYFCERLLRKSVILKLYTGTRKSGVRFRLILEINNTVI